MQKIYVCNPFNNVINTGIATLDMNNLLGFCLEGVLLTLGGTTFTKSLITLIQIKANGKVVFETDGAKLNLSEAQKGNASDATHLFINFMEQTGRTSNAFSAGAWDLSAASGITSLRMEVTISAATSPTLVASAAISAALPVDAEKNVRFLMHRRHRATQVIGASSQKIALSVPHIDPSGGGSVFKRVLIYASNLTSIQAIRNGIPDYDHSLTDSNQWQVWNRRMPQTGLFVMDFMLDNMMADRVWDTRPQSGVSQAILYGTFSATETITIETEELISLASY